MPAYWVALTIIAIWLPVSGVFTAEGIVTYYGFLQAYDPDTITGGIGQAWTLTVEVSFYALLPLLVLAVRRLPGRVVRSEIALVLSLFAAGVIWKAVMFSRAMRCCRRSLPCSRCLPSSISSRWGWGLRWQASCSLSARRSRGSCEWSSAGPGCHGSLRRWPSQRWVRAEASLPGDRRVS